MATTIQQIELPKKARAVDTSGNNNHGQIYSGRALEFDGITDHLNLGSNITVSTGAWTLACWVNIVSTPTNVAFSVNSNSVGGNTSAYIGIFASSLKLAVYDWGNTAWKESNTPLKLNTWCRIIFSYDGSGTLTFYQNGIADGEITLGASGNDAHFFARYIGSMSTGTRHFDGKMANWQAWDTAFTQADATYDYLNPESLALNNSGTALTESNLKLWYPMQDGHRGQQSYILDGANTGLGVELVTNGDFATDSDWSLSNVTASSNTSNGVAYIERPDSGNAQLSQTLTGLVAGKLYSISFNQIDGGNQLAYVRVAGEDIITPGDYIVGEQSYNFIAGSSNKYLQFMTYSTTGHNFTIDNISVKAINDKNHATTVFYGDDISDVAQGTFTDGSLTGWTLKNSAANTTDGAADYADITSSGSSNELIQLTSGFTTVIGRTYRVTFDRVAGTGITRCYVNTSTETITGDSTTAGTYTLDFVATATSHVVGFRTNNISVRCFIDNVKVNEIGVASGWTDADQQLHIPQTALQSYNELGWCTGTGDVAVGALGADLGANDFVLSYAINTVVQTGDIRFLNLAGSPDKLLHKLASNGSLKLYIKDSDSTAINFAEIAPAGTIVTGETYHIVESFNRSDQEVSIYINGVLTTELDISALSATANISASGNLNFHAYVESLSGFITEVALWKNTDFDSTEVLELYNDGKPLDALTHTKASTLYGYWRNNGLSTWVNLANPGTKDTTTNTLTETILIPQGVDSTRDNQGFIMNKQKSTSCLNSANTNDDDDAGGEVGASGTVILNSPSVDITSDLTICGWVKLKDKNASYNIIQKKTSWNSAGYGLYYHHTNDRWFIEYTDAAGSTAQKAHADQTIPLDEWYFICFTHDDSGNDVQYQASSSATTLTTSTHGSAKANIASSTNSVIIGSGYGGSNSKTAVNLSGQLDGFLIYNKTLDETEVLRNFKATKGNHRN